jgi:hypothetical protein
MRVLLSAGTLSRTSTHIPAAREALARTNRTALSAQADVALKEIGHR